MKITKFKNVVVGFVASVLIGAGLIPTTVLAAGEVGFTMSPMSQYIVLSPGDEYQSSVSISHANTGDEDFKYRVEVAPFTLGENNTTVLENENGHGEMAEWITLDSPASGTVAPNETDEIAFTIDVPEDAAGGGQYAAIVVYSDDEGSAEGMSINEVMSMAHLVYAEITGNTVKQGEFEEVSVPGFLFDGNIRGTSSIKNTGNTHGQAKYTLQVFPLFSDEEVYTNEEDPDTHYIIPDHTFYNETAWEHTPAIGIYNVVYTVEYEGVTKQVSKMVIKCPIWILFIIIAVIAGIIIWIAMRIRGRKDKKKPAAE